MPRKLPKMKTPVEIRQEQEKKMTFSDKWEEELKRQFVQKQLKLIPDKKGNLCSFCNLINSEI